MKERKRPTFFQKLIFLVLLLAFGELLSRGASYFLEDEPLPRSENHVTYAEHVKEFEAVPFRYQPYSIWRPEAYEGKHVNFDSAGWRRTVHLPGKPGDDTLQIGFFGGSTMMGWGCDDAQTIPSLVQNLLQEKYPNKLILCYNFGVSAYASSQEFISFWWEIFHNKVNLDFAVFYDGANDVWSSYEHKMAGVHNYYYEINETINLRGNRSKKKKFAQFVWQTFHDGARQKNSYLWRYVCRLIDRFLWVWVPPANEISPEEYGKNVAEAYFANTSAIASLCRSKGIYPFFFKQPLAATTIPRPEFPNDPFDMHLLDPYFQSAMDKITHGGKASGTNLTEVLNIKPDAFFDWCHITGEGNEIVSKAMIAQLELEIYIHDYLRAEKWIHLMDEFPGKLDSLRMAANDTMAAHQAQNPQ